MTTKQRNVLTVLTVAALLVAVIAGGLAVVAFQATSPSGTPAPEQTFGVQGVTGFDDLETEGDVIVNGYSVYAEAGSLTLTADGTLTPTASYQPVDSGSAVTLNGTTAIADGDQVGQVVCVVNENASDTITISDTANTNLSSAAVLGNDDTLCVLWDGADWIEIAQVDN